MNVGVKSKKKLAELLQNGDESAKNEKRTLYRSLWTTQTELPVLQEAIAEYDIIRQVGKGTFSTVYYALHKKAALPKDKSARKLSGAGKEEPSKESPAEKDAQKKRKDPGAEKRGRKKERRRRAERRGDQADRQEPRDAELGRAEGHSKRAAHQHGDRHHAHGLARRHLSGVARLPDGPARVYCVGVRRKRPLPLPVGLSERTADAAGAVPEPHHRAVDPALAYPSHRAPRHQARKHSGEGRHLGKQLDRQALRLRPQFTAGDQVRRLRGIPGLLRARNFAGGGLRRLRGRHLVLRRAADRDRVRDAHLRKRLAESVPLPRPARHVPRPHQGLRRKAARAHRAHARPGPLPPRHGRPALLARPPRHHRDGRHEPVALFGHRVPGRPGQARDSAFDHRRRRLPKLRLGPGRRRRQKRRRAGAAAARRPHVHRRRRQGRVVVVVAEGPLPGRGSAARGGARDQREQREPAPVAAVVCLRRLEAVARAEHDDAHVPQAQEAPRHGRRVHAPAHDDLPLGRLGRRAPGRPGQVVHGLSQPPPRQLRRLHPPHPHHHGLPGGRNGLQEHRFEQRQQGRRGLRHLGHLRRRQPRAQPRRRRRRLGKRRHRVKHCCVRRRKERQRQRGRRGVRDDSNMHLRREHRGRPQGVGPGEHAEEARLQGHRAVHDGERGLEGQRPAAGRLRGRHLQADHDQQAQDAAPRCLEVPLRPVVPRARHQREARKRRRELRQPALQVPRADDQPPQGQAQARRAPGNEGRPRERPLLRGPPGTGPRHHQLLRRPRRLLRRRQPPLRRHQKGARQPRPHPNQGPLMTPLVGAEVPH
mmetsp:Transcript_21892/g.67381  ORF Transcript_21892/g.67381 Transcript_21892/m.67381 type:complete len:818 (-) Transcript_21892:454-2907(-)